MPASTTSITWISLVTTLQHSHGGTKSSTQTLSTRVSQKKAKYKTQRRPNNLFLKEYIILQHSDHAMLLINPHCYHTWRKTRTCMQLVCRRVIRVQSSCQHTDVTLALKSHWRPSVTSNALHTVVRYSPCVTSKGCRDYKNGSFVAFILVAVLFIEKMCPLCEMLDFIFLHNTCFN